ncbi:AzlC family ABC transporter permease [Sedimentibacter hydroxybenzoicus DSM 7310]|uniref:AzlC family ABC transporter permease n=2 Tax=Sedimentibacter hydroxybenzoicus TaxID=29345 RepID=A0A974GWQ4_SEDHY|nr:AzlC family ABC transporter permease [Sedimentibacter hydroxybenzoicus DSM 7310]
MTGYIFLGAAYGIIMNSKGYGVIWALLMSLIVYAGSAQYVAITFLTSVFNPIYALFLTLMVNARHIFYGLSLMNKIKDTGKLKPFIIYWMSDETFSVLCAAEPKEGVDKGYFMFFISLLNYCYWALGTAMGSLLGNMMTFNTKGLDFALTALFVVIFISQWKSQKKHIPAIIGVLSSIACLIIFGPNNFIIPSMIVILILLTIMKNKIEGDEAE